MVNFICINQLDEIKNSLSLDEQVILRCFSSEPTKFECYEDILLISFNLYNMEKINEEPAPISIYFSKEHLIFICEIEDDAHKFKEWFGSDFLEKNSHEKVLYAFFDKLIKTDNAHLENLEEEIMDLEDDTITSGIRANLRDIIDIRRKLLRIKKYYEQLNGIFEGLLENEENLLTEKEIRFFKILDNRIDRLYFHTQNLRDYATQVREAYQAQVDIKSNNLMKLFTVITAIFSPLTLIVGWYGMNLRMPEFDWALGYPFVIAISMAVLVGCLLLFKKLKFFD